MRTVCCRLWYFILAVGCLASGCSTRNSAYIEQRLETIWELSDIDLDSAIESARMIKDSVALCGEITKQRYDLLNIRLRDKQYIVPSSVDSAKVIADYFEKHGTPKDRMRAYHYLSSAYRDLHDRPNAILNDLKAMEIADKESANDSAMLERIYSQLSTLYRQQLNTKKSIEMAIRHYEVSDDKIWAAMDVANAYCFDGDTANAMKYYEQSFKVLGKDSAFNYHPGLHTELLARFTEVGQKTKATTMRHILEQVPLEYRPQNYNTAMGAYCQKYETADSAIHYYKQDLNETIPIDTRCDAAHDIMLCYECKGMADSIAKYALLFAELNDAVIEDRRFEQTRNAEAEYHYQRNIEEETAIIKRDEAIRTRLFAMSLLLILIVFGSAVFYLNRRRRMLELIVARDKQISEYSKEINVKKAQNDALMQMALMRNTEDNASEVIKRFKKSAVGLHSLTINDWEELMSAIDAMYPTFKREIQDKIPRLTKPVLQTAYLMKAGISNPEIANLMDIPRQTVWYRSNLIKKAMGDKMFEIESI